MNEEKNLLRFIELEEEEEEEEAVVESTDEDEVVPPVKEDQKSEEDEPKKDDFIKDGEVISTGKYNQAIRKQREMELNTRELERQLEEARKVVQPKKEEDDNESFFDEEEDSKKSTVDIESLVDAKVKPVLERLNQKEAEEKNNQRTAFFEAHPKYLTDAVAWQELLDEMDNSLNPNSKDGYYKQLVKAHRILSGEADYTDIDKKKMEMASELSSKNDGSKKEDGRKSSADNREDRLAQKMPIGYTYSK